MNVELRSGMTVNGNSQYHNSAKASSLANVVTGMQIKLQLIWQYCKIRTIWMGPGICRIFSSYFIRSKYCSLGNSRAHISCPGWLYSVSKRRRLWDVRPTISESTLSLQRKVRHIRTNEIESCWKKLSGMFLRKDTGLTDLLAFWFWLCKKS